MEARVEARVEADRAAAARAAVMAVEARAAVATEAEATVVVAREVGSVVAAKVEVKAVVERFKSFTLKSWKRYVQKVRRHLLSVGFGALKVLSWRLAQLLVALSPNMPHHESV